MSEITKYYCDVCETETKKENKKARDVIFTTEQTEGRRCQPYLSRETFWLCDRCEDKVLKGNYIFAEGGQGYNNYYFQDMTTKQEER